MVYKFQNMAALGFLCIATLSLSVFAASAFADNINYHVENKQALPGAVKWDYLTFDDKNKRLFIAHNDHFDVYNITAGKITSTTRNTNGVHGVALVPELNHGFASNGLDNTVTVFDVYTFKPITTVKVENKPDAIAYDPTTKRVFVANGKSNNISVIDTATNKNIKTIELDGKPEFMAVDNKGKLFVNIEDKNQLVKVDTKNLTVLSQFNLAPACDEPAGLAIDREKERLFAGCHNNAMVIVDGDKGGIIATAPIGKNSDAVVFDAEKHLAFSSNGDGTLSVIGEDGKNNYKPVQTVKTMPTARTMALDPASHKIYLVGAEIEHIDQPSSENPHPRPKLKENTFTLITVAP